MKLEKLVRILWRVTAVLVGLHLLNLVLGSPVWQFERLFDMSREENVPTWFTSVLWLIAGVMAYQLSQATLASAVKSTWRVLAAGFLVLSADEVTEMHEHFGRAIEHRFYPQWLADTFDKTNWPITAAPFLALFLFWVSRRLWSALKSSPEAASWLAGGAGMVILGAMGFEMLNNLSGEQMKWVREFATIIEETLEMTGVIAIISGLLAYQKFLSARPQEVVVR